jgi:hypothetical protein
MAKVLIPFTDPESAERAVQRLLDESPGPSLEVELLAIVEPLTPGKVIIFLSPQRAEALVRTAATAWIARIGALLTAANVPYRGQIAVGRAAVEIDAAVHRADVDRVLLPARAPRWLAAATARHQSARLTRATHHPVTVVP